MVHLSQSQPNTYFKVINYSISLEKYVLNAYYISRPGLSARGSAINQIKVGPAVTEFTVYRRYTKKHTLKIQDCNTLLIELGCREMSQALEEEHLTQI